MKFSILFVLISVLSFQVHAKSRGGGGIYSFVDGGGTEHRFADRCDSDKEVRNNYREFRKKLKHGKSSEGFFGEYTDSSVGAPVTFYFYSNPTDCNKALAKAKVKAQSEKH